MPADAGCRRSAPSGVAGIADQRLRLGAVGEQHPGHVAAPQLRGVRLPPRAATTARWSAPSERRPGPRGKSRKKMSSGSAIAPGRGSAAPTCCSSARTAARPTRSGTWAARAARRAPGPPQRQADDAARSGPAARGRTSGHDDAIASRRSRSAHRGELARPAPGPGPPAAGSWPAPRAGGSGRRTSAACRGRSRRRPGGRTPPGSGPARPASRRGNSPRAYACASGRSRLDPTACTAARSSGDPAGQRHSSRSISVVTLCGSPRSTSAKAPGAPPGGCQAQSEHREAQRRDGKTAGTIRNDVGAETLLDASRRSTAVAAGRDPPAVVNRPLDPVDPAVGGRPG